MNSLHIIGNISSEVELRTTTKGNEVCNFTVAVNRRKTQSNKDPGADFFKVSVWNERGKTCYKFLEKGKKVSVVGPVSVRAYLNSKGEPAASLEITADDVEFLSPRENVVSDPDDPFMGR